MHSLSRTAGPERGQRLAGGVACCKRRPAQQQAPLPPSLPSGPGLRRAQVDILCTHPMFGPDSGRGSWSGLNFMFDKVRVGESARQQQRCDLLLKFFRCAGLGLLQGPAALRCGSCAGWLAGCAAARLAGTLQRAAARLGVWP
jgi:hypothetical protein